MSMQTGNTMVRLLEMKANEFTKWAVFFSMLISFLCFIAGCSPEFWMLRRIGFSCDWCSNLAWHQDGYYYSRAKEEAVLKTAKEKHPIQLKIDDDGSQHVFCSLKCKHDYLKSKAGLVTTSTQSTTTPWGAVPIVYYRYESSNGKGEISVDITGKGIEVRKWIIENIGEICSNQNIVLEAGKEPTKGGHYQILKELVEDGILTIEFKALY